MEVLLTSEKTRKLDQTPTWAVPGICTFIVIISFLLEKGLHKLEKWFTERKHRNNALFEALEKVKAELMILGFISLLLTFGQNYIAKICVPKGVVDTMLPCEIKGINGRSSRSSEGEDYPSLSWFDHRRFLADAESDIVPCKEGREQLISVEGLHQLDILIFFLALCHVLFSAMTVTLGILKTHGWEQWEPKTLSNYDNEFPNDPPRLRLSHQTTFGRTHISSWTRIPFVFYFECFFRQFYGSVSKADYLTLRNGFIAHHLRPGVEFNFQKYITRSLEDDFKSVLGVSPTLWASFVIFLLLNVSGWHVLFWASLVPIIIILAVGTKLKAIMTEMAKGSSGVVQGVPLVEASDEYFWFGRPRLLLHLIHFALFQNAFQITYFLWIWYSFGLKSCFLENFKLVILKIALGVVVQILCCYITLPLYALVTQMGSQMKQAIFYRQILDAVLKWYLVVKKRRRIFTRTQTC